MPSSIAAERPIVVFRKNLIFFGVAESDSESDASLVKSIIEKRMRISVGDDIDDAIRINGDMRPR